MPNSYAFADAINNTARSIALPSWVPWAGLYIGDPRTGALEVSASVPAAVEYARQQISFAASLNGVMTNSADLIWAAAEVPWGVLTHLGVNDGPSAGTLRRILELRSPLDRRTVTVGRIIRIPAGSLVWRSALAA
jgi:triphosphoribosyl-dephospho-CoA synthetase